MHILRRLCGSAAAGLPELWRQARTAADSLAADAGQVSVKLAEKIQKTWRLASLAITHPLLRIERHSRVELRGANARQQTRANTHQCQQQQGQGENGRIQGSGLKQQL
jgi:hypothetical protein